VYITAKHTTTITHAQFATLYRYDRFRNRKWQTLTINISLRETEILHFFCQILSFCVKMLRMSLILLKLKMRNVFWIITRCRVMARKSTAKRNTRTNHSIRVERKSVYSFRSWVKRVLYFLLFQKMKASDWLIFLCLMSYARVCALALRVIAHEMHSIA